MSNPLTLLPPTARKLLYVAYGLVALVVACVDVYYGAGDPDWVQRVQDVVAYLAVPMGVLAASNTPASAAEVAEVVAAEQAALVADDESPGDVEFAEPVGTENDDLPAEEPVDIVDVYGDDAREK